MYWARELSKQNEDPELSVSFDKIYESMIANESTIINDLNNCQGFQLTLWIL